MRPLFLVVVFMGPMDQGNSTFVVLENIAKLKPVSKQTSFQRREKTLISSYRIDLTFKWAKKLWLVKEILAFCSIGYILFMDDDSEYKVDD